MLLFPHLLRSLYIVYNAHKKKSAPPPPLLSCTHFLYTIHNTHYAHLHLHLNLPLPPPPLRLPPLPPPPSSSSASTHCLPLLPPPPACSATHLAPAVAPPVAPPVAAPAQPNDMATMSGQVQRLMGFLAKEEDEARRLEARRNKKLEDSLKGCPAPHTQVSATTDSEFACVPQCPVCGNVDVRFSDQYSTSSICVTTMFASSGFMFACLPCSHDGTLCIHKFAHGRSFFGERAVSKNCMRLSRNDYLEIAKEVAEFRYE